MKKLIIIIFISIYIICCVLVTNCLLHYNDYNISVFGDSSLVILKKNYDNLKKGSLVIVKKSNVKVNDDVFYFDSSNKDNTSFISKVSKIDDSNENSIFYTLENGKVLTNDLIIGTKDNISVYPYIGSMLGFLESKWGFLIIVILPFSFLFVFEIYTLVKEFRPRKKAKNRSKMNNAKVK